MTQVTECSVFSQKGMVRFSVGLDLGSQQVALAVYDYANQCAIPLELGGDKTMPACVAVEEQAVIVGKRAEGRSAKKCETVLCAHRQMLYGMHEEWKGHRGMCSQQWHFNVSEVEDINGAEPAAGQDVKAAGYRKSLSSSDLYGCSYSVLGADVSVSDVIKELVEVVCNTAKILKSPNYRDLTL